MASFSVEDKPIAVIIPNYNMSEYVDKIVEFIRRTTGWHYELIVVDNGSNKVPPSIYTTLHLKENLGTNAAWQLAFSYADRLERKRRVRFFAYLLCTTNFIIPETHQNKDFITALAQYLLEDESAVFINAAHTLDSETPWKNMCTTGTNKPRRVGFAENTFALIRASWFKQVERIDPMFYRNWGTDIDICAKAHIQKRTLWVHEGLLIKKLQNIGYKMDRYEVSEEKHGKLSSIEMENVLMEKYGLHWDELLHDIMLLADKKMLGGGWAEESMRLKIKIKLKKVLHKIGWVRKKI